MKLIRVAFRFDSLTFTYIDMLSSNYFRWFRMVYVYVCMYEDASNQPGRIYDNAYFVFMSAAIRRKERTRTKNKQQQKTERA